MTAANAGSLHAGSGRAPVRCVIGRRRIRIAFLITLLCAGGVSGASITITGNITQSTLDGTGPAVNNPSLNSILDGQPFFLSFTLSGPIGAPGTYDLTGSSLTFSVPLAGALETSFGFGRLTVIPNGSNDDISLLGCLTTGSGTCPPLVGNGITANFSIPDALLTSQNVAATGLDEPHPLDLLEDDGITDLHGSISTYSFTGSVTEAPEPSSAVCIACALAALLLVRKAITLRRRIHEEVRLSGCSFRRPHRPWTGRY